MYAFIFTSSTIIANSLYNPYTYICPIYIPVVGSARVPDGGGDEGEAAHSHTRGVGGLRVRLDGGGGDEGEAAHSHTRGVGGLRVRLDIYSCLYVLCMWHICEVIFIWY